jgi:hypothetical protein
VWVNNLPVRDEYIQAHLRHLKLIQDLSDSGHRGRVTRSILQYWAGHQGRVEEYNRACLHAAQEASRRAREGTPSPSLDQGDAALRMWGQPVLQIAQDGVTVEEARMWASDTGWEALDIRQGYLYSPINFPNHFRAWGCIWDLEKIRRSLGSNQQDIQGGGEGAEEVHRRISSLVQTVSTAHIFGSMTSREIPCAVDNTLPHISFEVVAGVFVSALVDSCAGVSTGRYCFHKHVMKNLPEGSYKLMYFDGDEPFRPLWLKGAIDQVREDDKEGKLFAVVVYNTTYKTPAGDMVKFAFALGNDVSVNTIIGLPTLRSLKGILDVVDGRFSCNEIGVSFAVDYKEPERWGGDATSFSIEIMDDAAQRGMGNESTQAVAESKRMEKVEEIEKETESERVVSFVGEEAFRAGDGRIDTVALQSIAELGVASLGITQDFRVTRG